jgi:hypothetical protein
MLERESYRNRRGGRGGRGMGRGTHRRNQARANRYAQQDTTYMENS